MRRTIFNVAVIAALIVFSTPGLSRSQLADSPWPMFRHDAMHRGRSQYQGTLAAILKWSYETGWLVGSSPAIGSDGTVYVGSRDNRLYSFNSNGSFSWSYETGYYMWSSPAIGSDGTIYVGSGDDRLYGFNSNGSFSWSYETRDGVYSSAVMDSDGTIYVGSDDNRLYGFNSVGSFSWSYETGWFVYSSPAIGLEGTVYVGSGDDRLYGFNSNGSFSWSYDTGDTGESSPAIGSDGTIYVGFNSYGLCGLNSDGSLLWSYETSGGTWSSPAISSDGSVSVGSNDQRFYTLDSTGSLSWSYQTRLTVDSSPAIGLDGTVYVGSQDNRLYSFNSDGFFLWSYETGDEVRSSPAIGSDGTIYVGSGDNRLYGICAPTPTSTPTSTPPLGDYAYVTNAGSSDLPGSTVSRIHTTTYAVDTIGVGSNPMGIDITPDEAYVLVVNNDSDTVSVINTTTAQEILQIPVGVEPLGIAIDHAGRYAYVTNSTNSPETTFGTVSVIDLTTFTVVDTITVGLFPNLGIDVSNDDSKLAVANVYDNTVWIIDTATREVIDVIYRLDGYAPMDVKFGPNDNRLYIAYYGNSTNDHVLSVDIEGDSPDLHYNAGDLGPVGINFRPGGLRFIVSNFTASNLYYWDMSVLAGEYLDDVDAGPYRSAFTMDGNRFFVPCYSSSVGLYPGTVDIVDFNDGALRIVKSVEVGINPVSVAIDNQRLSETSERFIGVDLYATPHRWILLPSGRLRSSDKLTFKWAVMPPDGVNAKVGVMLGIVYEDSVYYAFERKFAGLKRVNPKDIGSIPRVVDDFRINTERSGEKQFSVRGNIARGSYKFIVALTYPKDSNNIVYMNTGNIITAE